MIVDFRRLVLTVAAAGILTSTAAAPSGAAAADPIAINLGVQPGDSTGEGFYAQEMGFFKDAGLDVKITLLLNGPALTSAMASGALDVAVASVGVVATAHEHNLPMKYIAPAAMYSGPPPTTTLVVAKDSTVKTGADLNNTVIAVNGLKDLTQFTTEAWLDKNGADLKTIKYIEIPFSEMAVAVQQHRVAAALMNEPFLEAAKPIVREIGNAQSAIAPKFLIMGWFANESWIAKNPEAIRRFRIAMQKTAIWANAHHTESGAILLKYLKLDPDVAKNMTRATYDTSGTMNPAFMQPVIDAAAKYGTLTKSFPATELIANSP
jgi:NitT/TauT family transport system substrate-binding protein